MVLRDGHFLKIRGKGVLVIDKGPDYRNRLKGLRREIVRKGVDGLLVTDINNIRYLTGFTGSSGYVVVTRNKALLFTDTRYTVQAKLETAPSGFTVRIYKQKPLEVLAARVGGFNLRRLGFEGDVLSYNLYKKIKSALKPLRFSPITNPVAGVRAVKDPFEVDLIKKSSAILKSGFKKVERTLKAGLTEAGVALCAEEWMRKKGAEGVAFETIVASGQRGALPHGKASEKRIKKGELVVVDMGARFEGYNSDNTRTYCIGKANGLQEKIYGVVKEAQKRAIALITDGVAAVDVDGAARSHIKKAGYGKYFGHGTGHGVGLDVHERPSIGPASKDVFKEGMVVTVEPGIYIPGWGGVRIEDMALVKKDGCELMTASPDELVCL
ncbi:MAG: Xaa-Pro peptidase family protein [Thermodesulfobacteriota bacterium]|nr:MAG: Xaa-Pro peptidase family protein [Thermodesulfobacteriota bacterium]